MSEKPLVSVLITVYNDEKNIAIAVKSILEQTFQDFEIIIVNDGSTDNTEDVIKNLQVNDSRILLVNQNNQGTSKAANNGLSYCRGKYIARLDSDDYSFPHRLNFQFNYLESHPDVVLIGGGSFIIDHDNNIIGSRNVKTNNPQKTLMHRCIFQQSDVMFRKDAVLNLGGYRVKFKNAQDYDLWLRLSEVGQIAKVQEYFGVWRLNPGGYTLSRKLEQKNEVKIIKKMALLRRKGFDDGYESYVSNEKQHIHRNNISENDYKILIVQSLLKVGRKKDARLLIKSDLSHFKSNKKSILYLSTFLPDIIFKLIINAREYYLNKIQ